MPLYHKPREFVPLRKIAERKTIKNGLHHAIFTSRFDRYVGDWKKDLKEGKGLFLTINGKLYEGDWFKGFRACGDVREIMEHILCECDVPATKRMSLLGNAYPKPEEYRLLPLSGITASIDHFFKEHGFGTLSNRQPNGTFSLEYRGEWVRGKPEGAGWRYYPNGEVYFGFWKRGLRHGYGKLWYPNGTFYVGYWKDDKRDGLGMFVQDNGNRYEGNWEDNMKNGLGRFYHMHTGQLQEGIWLNNICIRSKMSDIIIRQFCDLPTPYPLPPEQIRFARAILDKNELWLKQKLGDIDKQLKYCIDQMY